MHALHVPPSFLRPIFQIKLWKDVFISHYISLEPQGLKLLKMIERLFQEKGILGSIESLQRRKKPS